MSSNTLDICSNNSDESSCTSDNDNEIIVSKYERAGDLSEFQQSSSSPQTFQDLTTSVDANVSNFNEAQFGTRFVAENMTVVIGGSQEKCTENSAFSQMIFKKSSTETKSVRIGRIKELKWICSSLSIALILLLVIISFSVTRSLESMAEEINLSSKDNKTHTITNTHLIEQNASIIARYSSFTHGFATPYNKSFNTSVVKKVKQKLKFPLIVGPYLSSESSPNETILVLSRLLRSLDKINILKVKSSQSDSKPVNTSIINAIFETSKCSSFPSCLSKFHNYPDLEYNFILFQGILGEVKGWTRHSDDDSLRIMFLFRDIEIIKDSLIYLFLVLINSSISCGYVQPNFTIKIHNNKFYDQAKGYGKFMSIVEVLKDGMYYVDDLDIFKLDTIKLSNKIRKTCPLFKTCDNTCVGQSCLKTVCEEDLCFVKCIDSDEIEAGKKVYYGSQTNSKIT